MHQSCLFIGGNDDGLTHPAPSDAESLQWPVGVSGQRETYNRLTLSLGDATVTVYVHENLTPDQVLNRLVRHYQAWALNRPGARR